jgi:hypothetical protein
MVFIEWLCLQNPSAEFHRSRPRLPGQQKPGLGLSMEIAELLVIMAERLEKDGLINIPRYYHTAYGARRVGFLFFDPKTEGIMRALERDFAGRSLSEASWAVELELVHRAGTPEPFVWTGEEQVLATSERMKDFFASEDYLLECSDVENSARFSVDWKNHERLRAEIEEG